MFRFEFSLTRIDTYEEATRFAAVLEDILQDAPSFVMLSYNLSYSFYIIPILHVSTVRRCFPFERNDYSLVLLLESEESYFYDDIDRKFARICANVNQSFCVHTREAYEELKRKYEQFEYE
jgi:hypothetical protein